VIKIEKFKYSISSTQIRKMTGHFDILDEDLERHLIGVLIAREAFNKGELPDDNLIDKLWEYRVAGGPVEAYRYEESHGAKNLEMLVRLVTDRFHTRQSKPAKIEMSDGDKEAIFFDDPKSTILYGIMRVKPYESFWMKSMLNVDSQNQTGWDDQKAVKLIVESPEARQFRSRREYQNLSQKEKKRFTEEYTNIYKGKFKVGRFDALSEEEKAHFYRMFAVDFHDLTDKEKKIYSDRFQNLHRKMVKNVVDDIVTDWSYENVPIRPHFMIIDGLETRIQRQIIVNDDGERVAEFEYILRRNSDNRRAEGDLVGAVLSASSKETLKVLRGYTRYVDHNDRKSLIIDKGDIALNFHMYSGFKIRDALHLAKVIAANYEEASEKFSGIKDLDERDTKILEAIRVEMSDIPSGFLVYAHTTSRDLNDKYHGIQYDPVDTIKTMVKDRIFPNQQPDNNYEECKFYLLNSQGISIEFQVMDPIMVERAEFGEARRKRYKDELKTDRYEKEVEGLSEQDMKLGLAFFGTDRESDAALSEVLADYYSRRISAFVEETIKVDTLQPADAPDLAEASLNFHINAEGIEEYLRKSKERLSTDDLSRVVDSVESLFASYRDSKGIGVLAFQDSLWVINNSIRALSESTDISLSYFERDTDLEKALHERHIELLYGVFDKMVKGPFSQRNIATALYVGYLIKYYNESYGLSNIGNPVEIVNSHRQSGKWKPFTRKRETIGYVPSKMIKSVGNVSRDEVSSVLREWNFDQGTITKVMGIYDKFNKQ